MQKYLTTFQYLWNMKTPISTIMKHTAKCLACLSAVIAMVSCDNLFGNVDSETDSDTEFYGTYLLTGIRQPKAFQEMGQMVISWNAVEGKPVLKVSEKNMTLYFPGGGYRTVEYTMDQENHILQFNKPLFFASDYFKTENDSDVISCSYRTETYKYKDLRDDNICLYSTGANPDNVNTANGEWSISFRCQGEQISLPEEMEINSEYGTELTPLDLNLKSGTIWSKVAVAGNRLFEFNSNIDMATAWFGTSYKTPSKENGEELIEQASFMIINTTEGTMVGITTDDMSRFIRMPYPETIPGKVGFWLSDGSALVVTVSDDKENTINVSIVEHPVGQYLVIPVKK